MYRLGGVNQIKACIKHNNCIEETIRHSVIAKKGFSELQDECIKQEWGSRQHHLGLIW
jgi:hypothetical protein